MFTRPSLRAVVATTGAAALLVAGASLASYAANAHGAGSAQPRTSVFTFGKPQQMVKANTVHLFSAKVPKGTYQIGVSGFTVDKNLSGDIDNVTCVVADKKTFSHFLSSGGSLRGSQRLFAVFGSRQGTIDFGALDQTNPAARIDRPSIVYGCLFNGIGPFEVARPLQFTLTPVKVTREKPGKPFQLPAAKVRDLVAGLR